MSTAEHVKLEQLKRSLQKYKENADALYDGKYVAKVEGKDLVSATDIAQIGANKTAIETLKAGEAVEGSVAKAVKDGINAFATEVSDDATVNTFKELVDYAATHNAEYSTLAGEVQGNTTAVQTLNGDTETVGSVDYKVKAAVDQINTNLDGYVKVSDLTFATNDDIDAMINEIFGTSV